MAQESTNHQKSQIQKLLEQKQKIQLVQLHKLLDQKQAKSKLPQTTIKQISKSSYRLWQKYNKPDRSLNKLIRNQIYELAEYRIKQKAQDIGQVIDGYNNELKTIGEKQIQRQLYRKSLQIHSDPQVHIYQFYKSELQKQMKQKKQSIQNEANIKQVKAVDQKMEQNIKNINKDDETKHKEQQKQIDGQNIKLQEMKDDKIKNIVKQFIKTNNISQEQTKYINEQTSSQFNAQLLRQFNNAAPKALEDQQRWFSAQNMKSWFKQYKMNKNVHNMQTQQMPGLQKKQKQKSGKTNKEKQQSKKNQDISQKKDKQKQKDQKRQNKKYFLLQFFKKYLKKPQNIRKQKKLQQMPKLQLLFNLNTNSPLQNTVQYKLNFLIGQKQITKTHTELQQKKLISEIDQRQYTVIQVYTNKAEEFQQKLQSYIKEKKINKNDLFQIKTYTQADKLYLSLKLKQGDKNKASVMKQIYKIITQQSQQNYCRIQNRIKFGLGNQAKQRPEDRKIMKCIVRGFQFFMSVSGNSNINSRFRKNLQIQNSQSTFFSLLALTKSSQFKMNWKSIEDTNNFFSRLGVLQALKATPSIKQVVHDTINQLFETQNGDIISLIEIMISEVQTNKVIINRIDQKTCVSLSLQNNIKNIIKK